MATVKITGLQSMIKKLTELGANVENIVDNSVHKSAYAVQAQVKKNIEAASASYNGRTYKAFDTGNLYRHIAVERLGKCRFAVGTNVEYAPYVEFGTGSAGDPEVAHTARPKWTYYSKTAGGYRTAYPQPARPYMRPAFASMKDVVTLNASNAITEAWAKGVGL